jgi:hypothetical protein
MYSKWRPDRGGYQYYDVAERRGLGDDLPIPRLSQVSSIGVASTSVGRTPPLAGKLVGSGAVAKGCILPLDRSGLSGIAGTVAADYLVPVAAVISAIAGVIFGKKLLAK